MPGVLVVTSPTAAENVLATCLEKLERLGLARPASALVTEYLAALTAENVVDAETAARVAAAYHRLRYGAVDPGDLDVRQAVARLEEAAKAVAAMPDAARHDLAERIGSRLSPWPAGEMPPAAAQPSVLHTRPDWGAIAIGKELAADLSNDADSFPDEDSALAFKSKAPKRRRDVRIRSWPLETVTLVVVGLIFIGYIFRHGIDEAIGPNAAEAPASGRPPVIARDVWRHDDYWAANLRRRAQTEAAKKRDRTARLAYELLLSDVPRDAGALNDLAWLYLTSDEPAVRDPKRGLELALRALAISRQPSILDTAAEARFQAGQTDEAVKLEQEALESFPRFFGRDDKQFRTLLQRDRCNERRVGLAVARRGHPYEANRAR
jgi:tetratricopeptide (TPR) repeat protein